MPTMVAVSHDIVTQLKMVYKHTFTHNFHLLSFLFTQRKTIFDSTSHSDPACWHCLFKEGVFFLNSNHLVQGERLGMSCGMSLTGRVKLRAKKKEKSLGRLKRMHTVRGHCAKFSSIWRKTLKWNNFTIIPWLKWYIEYLICLMHWLKASTRDKKASWPSLQFSINGRLVRHYSANAFFPLSRRDEQSFHENNYYYIGLNVLNLWFNYNQTTAIYVFNYQPESWK